MFGHWEILIVLVIILVVFGAGKLPRVMGDLGKGIGSFKKGMAGEDEMEEKPEAPKKTVAKKTITTAKKAAPKKPVAKKATAKKKPAAKKSTAAKKKPAAKKKAS